MFLKHFKEDYPNYTGYLLLTGNFFVDKKMEEMLKELDVQFMVLNINNLDNPFLKFLNPDIGPNLFRFNNGEVIKTLNTIQPIAKLKEWIESD